VNRCAKDKPLYLLSNVVKYLWQSSEVGANSQEYDFLSQFHVIMILTLSHLEFCVQCKLLSCLRLPRTSQWSFSILQYFGSLLEKGKSNHLESVELTLSSARQEATLGEVLKENKV